MIKPIIFLFSYHHKNTQKIGNAIAEKINAEIIDINNTDKPIELDDYNLIGFGSGIDSGKHYPQLLEFVEKLAKVQNKKAFIFSTCGIYGSKKMVNDHKALRGILVNKGFEIIGEFSCKGFDTNSVLKYIGGLNKNRPNDEDIKKAEIFAGGLLNKN
jgi:flavodoxin